MQISDIPYQDRDRIYGALHAWRFSEDRLNWLLGTYRNKVTGVSIGSVPPINGDSGTTIPVTINSSSTGFDVEILVYTEPGTSNKTIAKVVLPWFPRESAPNGNDAGIFGHKKKVSITSTTQTFYVHIPSKASYVSDGFTLPFKVLVNENLDVEFNNAMAGPADVQSAYTFSYDPPIIEAFSGVDVKYGYLYSRFASGLPEYSEDKFETNPKSLYNETEWEKEKNRWTPVAVFEIDTFTIHNGKYFPYMPWGLCWSTSQNPTAGTNDIAKVSVPTQLPPYNFVFAYHRQNIGAQTNNRFVVFRMAPNTHFYVRPYANNGKLAYGAQFEIDTPTWEDGETIHYT
jgi:hypothetical protein